MLYEAKQGSKAYEYIKGILEAEEKEYQAYMKRVDEAVGFEFDKWQGYQPNRSLLREYLITAIWLPTAQYEKLDKKLWRKVGSQLFDEFGGYCRVLGETEYKPFTHVLFYAGYAKDRQVVEKKIESISIGKPQKGMCPEEWLNKDVFIIKFK